MSWKVILVVLGAVVFGLLVGGMYHRNSQSPGEQRLADVSACPDPLVLESPVDVKKATAILYPGQVRGGDFKRHGGFRFDTATSNAIEVRAPIDSTLSAASRYIERGQLQYLLDFETGCRVRYRLDHVRTLTPALMAVLEKLPEARVDDSRTTNITTAVHLQKGELIATEIGMPGNVFVDFGVYKSGIGFQDPLSSPLCWLELLPASQAAYIKNLPAGDGRSGKQSEYCG